LTKKKQNKETEKTDAGNDQSTQEIKKDAEENDIEYFKDQLKRVQAEFENYRKRTDLEKAALREFYTGSFLQKLIPILDNFEVALSHECADKNYALGISMLYNSFKSILECEDVKEINVAGEKFNPHFCEVVEVRNNSEIEDGIVVEVKHKGYKLKDKIIRRAIVVVNKNEKSNKNNN